MMDSNSELLTYIHQNSEMGKDTLRQLMPITSDPGFSLLLRSQFSEYNAVNSLSERKLKERNKAAKDIGPLTKAASYISINLNTLTSKKPSHISEMLIQGSTMGVIDITRKINEYQMTADKDVIDLAGTLLNIEQKNIEECKKYLQ
jgi:hypothetical protein